MADAKAALSVATGEGWYPIFGEDRMPIVTLTPTNLQKMEFNVTTAEGPSRVTIVTGKIPLDWAAAGALDRTTTENRVMKVLVDPALTIDKFRKAVATVTIGGISRQGFDPDLVGEAIPRSRSEWIINDAQAYFDDEAGRVQLVIDATVTALAEEVRVTAITFALFIRDLRALETGFIVSQHLMH